MCPKCWNQPRKRRVAKSHGKEGRAGGLNSYSTKPFKGHHWVVDRDSEGKRIYGTRRCKNCGLPPPGRGDSKKKSALPIAFDVTKKRVVKSFRTDD